REPEGAWRPRALDVRSWWCRQGSDSTDTRRPRAQEERWVRVSSFAATPQLPLFFAPFPSNSGFGLGITALTALREAASFSRSSLALAGLEAARSCFSLRSSRKLNSSTRLSSNHSMSFQSPSRIAPQGEPPWLP